MLQLVVLVAIIVVGLGCVRLVRIVVLIVEFSRVQIILHISLQCMYLSAAIGTTVVIGR